MGVSRGLSPAESPEDTQNGYPAECVFIKMFYVYLLKSLKDKRQYIGSTTDIRRRLKEHNLGFVKSTKYRRPLILLGYQECKILKQARQLERKYKKSSGALKRAIAKKELVFKKNFY